LTQVGSQDAVSRGAALIAMGRPKDAADILRHAAASDPSDARARCLLAFALLEAGEPQEAVEAAELAIASAPDEEWGHRLLALALLRLGRTKRASRAADRAVALDPNLAETHLAVAQVEHARRRFDRAEAAARRAIELAPESADGHYTLGRVMLGRERWRDAEVAFRRALSIDPEDAAAHNDLGVALYHQGKRDWATRAFERSAQIDPRQSTGRENIVRSARDTAFSGLPIGLMIYGTYKVMSLTGESGSPLLGLVIALVVIWLIGSLIALGKVRTEEDELPARTRALLADERSRTRRRPWTWRPTWVYLPPPLGLLFKLPPPVGLALGLSGVTLMLVNSGGYEAADWVVFACVVALTAATAFRTREFVVQRGWH
jgi:tetratricopeptide (TPR) repeat protein